MDEFSHTLLHNQNVFDEFKKIQTNKKQEEEKKADAEEQARQAQAQMANLNTYQPPESYMQQYNDPSFFNYEYQKYKAHLASPNTEEDASTAGASTPQAMSRAASDISEDRNQDDIQNLPQASDQGASTAPSSDGSIHNEGQYSSVTGNVSKDEMINITSCEFPEFKAFMSEKYGGAKFDQGFAIVKQHQDVIFEDNGEQQLMSQMSSIFPEQDTCSGFINYCTTYLIVQNMNVGV